MTDRRYPVSLDGPDYGWVYIARAGGVGRPVKVGFTRKDPPARLAELQVGHPETLHLLAAQWGHKSLEKQLHVAFQAYHVRGEWYRPMSAIFLEFGLPWDRQEAVLSWEYAA